MLERLREVTARQRPGARVAFAGLHRQLEDKLAVHSWAAAFARDAAVTFVGAFDAGAETREAFAARWGGTPTFDDYAAMLRETRPEYLCLATRQTMHADQVETAVAAGVRGILCDKPLATSMGEVDRIVGACRAGGVALAFGLDRRWVRYWDRLTGMLRDGLIGEVRSVVGYGCVNLINHGPHWYDRLLALAGDPEVEWVSGEVDPLAGEAADSRRHQDPPGRGLIRFASGVDAVLLPRTHADGFDMSFDVMGSRGRVAVHSDGAATHVWRDGALQELPELAPGQGPPWADAPPWPTIVADLLAGGPTRCDVDHVRRASEIGFAVHQSSREGGRRVSPAEVDRALRVASFPWGNE